MIPAMASAPPTPPTTPPAMAAVLDLPVGVGAGVSEAVSDAGSPLLVGGGDVLDKNLKSVGGLEDELCSATSMASAEERVAVLVSVETTVTVDPGAEETDVTVSCVV